MPEYIAIEVALSKAIEERRFVLSTYDMMNEEYVIETAYSDLAEFLYSLPRADVAEVKHGHIIEHQGHEDECYCECSVCKSREVCIDDKFCSECGAKMDGN